MERQLKMLSRAVALECYANGFAGRAFRDIENAYKEMLKEIAEYAVKRRASQNTPHSIFYEKFRKRFPWLPMQLRLVREILIQRSVFRF